MTILKLVGGHDFAWFHRNFGGGMQPMSGGKISGARLAAMCRTLIVNGYDSATIGEPYWNDQPILGVIGNESRNKRR
jgi:hypothetical protein